jgi:rfaE bifunctional protein kinase chain/domain
MAELTTTDLNRFRSAFPKARIGVIGDLMLDRYFLGSVTRMSPEAPVPVLDMERKETRLGGAANVANNIKSLTATPYLFGVTGDDGKGEYLRRLAVESGFNTAGIISDPSRPTTIKTRVISGSQQMLRIDSESRAPISDTVEDALVSAFTELAPSLDGLILEDYNKGVMTASLIERILSVAAKHNIKTFVDPKFDNFFRYRGVTVFKPNRKETQDALGLSLRSDADINSAGKLLLERLGAEHILLTLSEKGMRLYERSIDEPFIIPTRAHEVADVSGAGDTVIATLAIATVVGASVRQAAVIANRAAGIVVAELGIVPIELSQLFDALENDITP